MIDRTAARKARVKAALEREKVLTNVAARVAAILEDGLSGDGSLTLEGAVVLAYRELRPALDEILDAGTR